jgi:hypothetical protein
MTRGDSDVTVTSGVSPIGGSGFKARSSRTFAAFGPTLALAAAGLVSSPAEAQGVKIVGVGAATCAAYLNDIQAEPGKESNYLMWAQGYLSGLLIRAPAGKDESLDLTPPTMPMEKQAAFLRAFCEKERGADFSDGVGVLYRTLRAPPG